MKSRPKEIITQVLRASGIIVNGNHPWDIHVNNEDFYARILRDGEIALGESYMDGWWDSPRIDMAVDRLFEGHADSYLRSQRSYLLRYFIGRYFEMRTNKQKYEASSIHYDLGNLLFQSMLGSDLLYSCAHWGNTSTLEEAQLACMDLTCRKLLLQPGMRLLDTACGWGTFAKYVATNYDVSVIGVTTSKQQFQYAKKVCENLPIEIRMQDFRDIKENFDRIVSIGGFKHISYNNYRGYMQYIHDRLPSEGLYLLDTFGGNTSVSTTNMWIRKYIFPGSVTPSIAEIGKATETLLVMEDWQNYGQDFDKTLMVWHKNFNDNWDSIKVYYDERFFRMWNFYLLASAAAFRARSLQSWQIVFSRTGLKGGYHIPE